MRSKSLFFALLAVFALAACGDPCQDTMPEVSAINESTAQPSSGIRLLGHFRMVNTDPVCEYRIGQLVARWDGASSLQSFALYSGPDPTAASLAESSVGGNPIYQATRRDNGFWLILKVGSSPQEIYIAGDPGDGKVLGGVVLTSLLFKTYPSPFYDGIGGTPRQGFYSLRSAYTSDRP